MDGVCCAAIVKYFEPDVKCYKVDYGLEFPHDKWEEGDTIYLVDFSLPEDDMKFMRDMTNLIWIDHHKTAIDRLPEDIMGIRDINAEGACSLVWKWFTEQQCAGGYSRPYSVIWLGQYDVWNHENPNVLPFQYGARAVLTSPDSPEWDKLLAYTSSHLLADIVKEGAVILKSMKEEFKQYTEIF